ncbi:MAG: hypothetical protein HC840_29735 [Leptolyngbyaceae cyanobacterium RM2_2_4]|nr:hypothetical protein [Leptolyngbyaceae cyanobacterium SM1_4_3]NJN90669.1 hypothetical protein [Leptolyngbyaceae cyanobacterium SL_5_14]NJO52880.1 hypothetical protein [Leptolyngbyaceae cyanobacterium RM2_2_4]
MTKFRGDRSTHSIRSVEVSLVMGDRRLSSKALDLWLLAVCSCLLTLLCHSLTHPSSLPSSLNSATSTPASTATPNSSPAPVGSQRAPQFFVPAKSSAPDQELKSDADE